MRTLLGSLILVLMSTCLTGCLSGGDPSPSTTPSSSRPVLMPTPSSATPTSQWTDEEQQAIDAVLKYYEVWNHISQNPDETDLDSIYEVAMNPIAEEDIKVWQQWKDYGWRLLGSVGFVPLIVTYGMKDGSGHEHNVHGCYILEGADIVDDTGSSLPSGNRIERNSMIVTVLHSLDGSFVVVRNRLENKPC